MNHVLLLVSIDYAQWENVEHHGLIPKEKPGIDADDSSDFPSLRVHTRRCNMYEVRYVAIAGCESLLVCYIRFTTLLGMDYLMHLQARWDVNLYCLASLWVKISSVLSALV